MKDLNLLRVFEAVWATRSVSRAAERLALTQPAVSSALARLRQAYGDPLFTRAGAQMAPTAFCSEQAHYLLDALSLVERSLSAVQAFDPASSDRKFILGMRDIGEATLLLPVLAAVGQAAPGVRFHTVLSPLETTNQKLADGRVDLAVGFLPAHAALSGRSAGAGRNRSRLPDAGNARAHARRRPRRGVPPDPAQGDALSDCAVLARAVSSRPG